MEKLESFFEALCGDHWSFKTVSHNDKDKGGLYVTKAMQKVMSSAGIEPVLERDARDIRFELVDSVRDSGVLSYYESQRNNRPEPRMGRDIVSSWLSKGDKFYIGWTGEKLIAAKLTAGVDREEENVAAGLEKYYSEADLRARATGAGRKPQRKNTSRIEYERNPVIIAYVQKLAAGECEMEGCNTELFKKADGKVYLEVHHIEPLSEGGRDSIQNTAALCPNCHRAQHYAVNRQLLRGRLANTIQLKESCLA